MKSKYLFLDFDGVLHPDRYSLSNYDPDRVFRSNEVFSQAPVLAGLITEFPCQIIISSSWRFTYNLDEMKENGKKWVELNQELIEKIKKLEYQSLYKR